jgi:hypothetical protein
MQSKMNILHMDNKMYILYKTTVNPVTLTRLNGKRSEHRRGGLKA